MKLRMKPPNRESRSSYRIQEFAELTGVTVRALHHYDRLGLLKPLRRTRTGYRVYRNSDFARLEQIVVLKFLGLPLKDIGRLLKKESHLQDTLGKQRHVLGERRRRLDAAIRAIERAEQSLDVQEPDWELFRRIVKEIEMQNDAEWTKQYYSESARAKVDARKASWSPELQARVSQQWSELVADVETALSRKEDPTGVTAQALVARWKDLLAGFTGGDPEIQRGLNKMWADRQHWPDGPAKSFRIRPEVQDFIMTAIGTVD
jgi:MerR family transcriptional regulator, thiopeptide resistance regulator